MPKRLTPPAHLPRWLLLRVLAYQVQAAALGGAAGRGGLAAGLQDYGAGAFDDQSGRGRFRRCAIACGTHPARGRRAIGDKKPEIREALRRLVEPATLGDPMRPLIWVSKSLAKLASALTGMGFSVGADTVRAELLKLGFSRQGNRKAEEGSNHPDRARSSNTSTRRSFRRLFAAGAVEGLYFALPMRVAATALHARVEGAVCRLWPKASSRPAGPHYAAP